MSDDPKVELDLDAAVVEEAVEAALKKVLKADSIGTMSAEDFKGLVYVMLHDQRLITARNEAVASARIFMDIDGFKAAASTPFRITNTQQLDSFVANLREAIVPGKTQLAIAVALVTTESVGRLPGA